MRKTKHSEESDERPEEARLVLKYRIYNRVAPFLGNVAGPKTTAHFCRPVWDAYSFSFRMNHHAGGYPYSCILLSVALFLYPRQFDLENIAFFVVCWCVTPTVKGLLFVSLNSRNFAL